MTKQEEQIKRIVDMKYIYDVAFRPLSGDRWQGSFMNSCGHYVGRIVGESIEVVLNLLEEEAIEYKNYKRREKRWSK